MPTNDLYIDLLKSVLMHSLWERKEVESPVASFLKRKAPRLFGRTTGTQVDRLEGRVWPEFAHTMIGLKRLENIQYCVKTVIDDNIGGDFIETGVWRGGACIFMQGLLKAYGEKTRNIWLADSFEGLPKPRAGLAVERGDRHHTYSELKVSLDEVRSNFEAYGLMGENVKFLKGWFKDTLPTAPIDRIAICRLDGDMYSSTMDAIQALYSKVEPGGFVIVDDYGAVPGCKKAIDEFREENNIRGGMESIDWSGVYWRK